MVRASALVMRGALFSDWLLSRILAASVAMFMIVTWANLSWRQWGVPRIVLV
jgi:hypothetical protein